VILKPGMPAPDFELADADGVIWRLGDLRGRRVIVYFYPADDTPGCTAQACDFRDSQAVFRGAGYTVLGVSPQGAESHRAFSTKFGLNFPLLIDSEMEMARRYGVTAEKARDYKGIPLEVTRSTFIIDEDGVIEQALYDVKARGHVDSLLKKLSV
jgi:peroxiredoxin Q/BCP